MSNPEKKSDINNVLIILLIFIFYHPAFGKISKKNKKLAVKTTHNNENGKNIFQPNFISWSKRYLGTIAFTKENKIKSIKILNIIQKAPGNKLNGKILIGLNQPPKKRIEPRAQRSKIFAYSPSQNIAYIIPEYSV